MEVAVAVTVGDGDDEEVFVGTALRGGQSFQGPVQLALARTLGHRTGFLPRCPHNLHLAPISHFGHMLLQAPVIVGAAGVEAVVGMLTLILVCGAVQERQRSASGQRSTLLQRPQLRLQLPPPPGVSGQEGRNMTTTTTTPISTPVLWIS